MAAGDVGGYTGLFGLSHIAIECLDGRCGFEPGLKIFGDSDDAAAIKLRDQLELELDGLPAILEEERRIRRRQMIKQGAKFMASKLAFGLAAIDAADASYAASLDLELQNWRNASWPCSGVLSNHWWTSDLIDAISLEV